MVDFVRLAATAQRLIEANGRLVTLYKQDRTPTNPAQPWRGSGSTPTPPDGAVIGPVLVAFVPASGSGFGKTLFDADKSLMRKIEQVGFLATKSVTDLSFTTEDVERCDSVADGTKALKIVMISHLQPADTSLIFVLGLKR